MRFNKVILRTCHTKIFEAFIDRVNICSKTEAKYFVKINAYNVNLNIACVLLLNEVLEYSERASILFTKYAYKLSVARK